MRSLRARGVGIFCAIGLFVTFDNQTLLLQLKEAQTSVLVPYAGPSKYVNQGQRVVVGQRIMQALPDVFLGWTEDHGDDQQCYVRQLKDSRLALISTDLAEGALPYYATLCGATLARAHARIRRHCSDRRLHRHRDGVRYRGLDVCNRLCGAEPCRLADVPRRHQVRADRRRRVRFGYGKRPRSCFPARTLATPIAIAAVRLAIFAVCARRVTWVNA